ncbi:transcription initiation factor TFIID subunit 7 [Blastomyces silverae]|uniref:Transcription initiation factor TFIID subunit 7 n=1 Tax=Blastomyces silverae TaxID=2060906 RepID=A0A0H1BDR5_9EURO|nr:transcription initiation factor TFIID subunit 7 [Blastomyces silverae]
MLKLTFSKPKVDQVAKSAASPPPPSTPTTPGGSSLPKLKFKIGPKPKAEESAPPASASKSSKKPKASRSKAPQDTPRTGASKKRARDTSGHDAGVGTAARGSRTKAPTSSKPPAVKRIKLSTRPPPSIRLKSKGEPPARPKGVGYDSEASDTEKDPALEEQFILRMQPGEDCDYLRQAVAEKRFGPRSQGGADISFKSLTRDGRRAVLTIRGRIYAASLVDLPCIIEGMKSWDRRGWYKSADICQMLLVLGRVNSEEEARTHPLPKDIDESTFQYAHGVTPPLRWVRKRRFRKRISNRTIEAVELEVARLLKEDTAAESPPEFEILDYAQYMRETSGMSEDGARYNLAGQEYDDEQDAEGEEDEYGMDGYPPPSAQEDGGDDFEDELAAEMEAALAAHADGDSAPGLASETAGETPIPMAAQTAVPISKIEPRAEMEGEVDGYPEPGTPNTKLQTPGETSGDEDEDEDDESEEGSSGDEADLDEDALEQQRQLEQQREEIAELEALVQTETLKWESMANPILKSKLGKRVQNLKQALELKKVSFGEGGEDG